MDNSPRKKDLSEAIEDAETRKQLMREVQELMGCFELNDWEAGFLESIEEHLDRGFTSASGKVLSDRQVSIIESIKDKC